MTEAETDSEHDPSALLRLRGVARTYGEVTALAPCDLDVAHGQVTVVAGPNGAGKTTLVQVMAGLLEPTAGQMWIGGVDVASVDGRLRLRTEVAHAGDLAVLYPELTLAEHLELVARAFGVRDPMPRTDRLLTALGLDDRRRFLPHELSAGMRQKLQLAAAFIRPCRLLLLDEPTRALDRESREAMWRLIAESRADDIAVVVITHDETVPRDIIDRGMVIDHGRVVADGPASVVAEYLGSDGRQ